MRWTEGPRDGSRLVQREARQGRLRAGQTWLESAASGIVELDDARRPKVAQELAETGRTVVGDARESGCRPEFGARAMPVSRRLAILSKRNE
jgi:hypothetical protein